MELDKKQRQRLDELAKAWEGKPSSEKLSPQDLQLMLQHYPPLQALIRAIAHAPAPKAAPEPSPRESEAINQASELKAALEKLQACHEGRRQLEQALEAARQQIRDLENKVQTLTARNEALQERSHPELQRALDILRSHPQLAKPLDLADLGAQAKEGLRVIVTLAQRQSLLELHEALVKHADAQRRPIGEEERWLLEQAIAWYNLYWREKRLVLCAPEVGSGYDFNKQRRAPSIASGETIRAVWVPGICTNDGQTVCKPVVETG